MRVIAGSAKGIPLKAPDGLGTRPTADRVKEAVFSSIQFEIEGRKVLDLFGGTGQMGIEALSRGAESAVFVDRDPNVCKIIRENLKKTKLENRARVFCGDYMTFLGTCREKFDLIILDPPYMEDFLENALKTITEIDILQSGGIMLAERPFGRELPWKAPESMTFKDHKYGKTLVTVYRRSEAL